MRNYVRREIIYIYIYTHTHTHTVCNRRKGPNFGRVFLMWNYTEKTQNTYIQSWTVWEIIASEVWNWQEYVVSVMLISVLNIKVTCEWHKAIKLNDKNSRHTVVFVLRLPSTVRSRQLLLSRDVRANMQRLLSTKHWDTTASTVWPSKEMQGYAFHASFSSTVLPRTN